MVKHGVRFQPSLSGALHTARTNAFFMGGGKALINAYYRSAEKLGIQIQYNAEVNELEIENGVFKAALVKHKSAQGEVLRTERITAKACVMAAGGFSPTFLGLKKLGVKTPKVNIRPTTS
jgi:tricarballylate dehydrogenase